MRTLVGLVVLVLGCGTSAPPEPTPPEPTPPVVSEVAPPSSVVAEGSVAPPNDFTMEAGGGLVLMRPPQPGEMVITTRLEPRASAAGEFDLVQRSEPAPPSEGTPSVEMHRVSVPAARVAAIYGIIARGRAVLERPCVNMDVLDGESHFVRVHAAGADAEYRCTNTSTPELDALQLAFAMLVSDSMPAGADS